MGDFFMRECGKVYGRFLLLKIYKTNRLMCVYECLNCGDVIRRQKSNESFNFRCKCFQNKRKGINNWTKLHYVHKAMITRCYNPKHKQYKDYGGRGISVCEEWKLSTTFIDWAYKNGYKEGLQIDRVDNDGNYNPKNCRWATYEENNAIGRKRMQSDNTSGYIGVSKNLNSEIHPWRSYITINKKRIYLGIFKTKENAIIARIESEVKYFGCQKTNLHFKRMEEQ